MKPTPPPDTGLPRRPLVESGHRSFAGISPYGDAATRLETMELYARWMIATGWRLTQRLTR